MATSKEKGWDPSRLEEKRTRGGHDILQEEYRIGKSLVGTGRREERKNGWEDWREVNRVWRGQGKGREQIYGKERIRTIMFK